MSWQAALEAVDVGVVPMTPREVVLELPSGAREQVRLVRSSGTLHPATMRRAGQSTRSAGPARLWVAPSASPAAVEFARRSGDSLVTRAGHVLVQVRGEVLEQARPRARDDPRPPGPPPWGTLAVARRLLEVDVDRQQDLALLSGLSQERVSRILSRFRAQGLTTRSAGAVGRPVERPTSVPALLDWWLDHYPRDEALRAHYFATDPPAPQLARAADALSSRRPLLSGDLAADQLAPWRRPGQVLLYCAWPLDLAEVGFVAASAAQATLTVVTSPDPTVSMPLHAGHAWAEASAGGGTIELADPFQVLLDLYGSPVPDAPEAVARLREELLTGPARQRARSWLERIAEHSGPGDRLPPALDPDRAGSPAAPSTRTALEGPR